MHDVLQKHLSTPSVDIFMKLFLILFAKSSVPCQNLRG